MTHHIDRLAVRCLAPVGRKEEATRLERRLLRIARDLLPSALATVLPDTDHRVDTITTALPGGIVDHDDETVAWLWAGAIAHSVSTSGAGRPGSQGRTLEAPAVSETETTSSRVRSRQSQVGDLARVGHRLGRPATAWWSTHPTGRKAAAVHALTVWLEAHGLDSTNPGSINGAAPLVVWLTRVLTGSPDVLLGELAYWLGERAGRIDFESPSSEAVEAEVGPGSSSASKGDTGSDVGVDESAGAIATEWASIVGGVTLVYPWLERLLRVATELFGETVESRMAALWELVGVALPYDAALTVLAGAAPGDDLDWDMVARSSHPLLSAESALILPRLTSLFPGSWTSDVILEELVFRSARVYRHDAEWVIDQASRPLDPLLRFLPYPTTYFRFEWTLPISVRWP